MTYAETFAKKHVGQTRELRADESRRAALELMKGVAEGWTKLDLALWLRGAYAQAVRHAPRVERAGSSGAHPRAIGEPTIEHLLVSTRGQLLASLELAVLAGGTPDFIERALIEQHVRRVVDESGEAAWVPADVPRMRLKDRVASLFVADYLNRPNDYRHLYVCHLCEAVTFEHGAKELGRCGAHRVSFVRVRTGHGV